MCIRVVSVHVRARGEIVGDLLHNVVGLNGVVFTHGCLRAARLMAGFVEVIEYFFLVRRPAV